MEIISSHHTPDRVVGLLVGSRLVQELITFIHHSLDTTPSHSVCHHYQPYFNLFQYTHSAPQHTPPRTSHSLADESCRRSSLRDLSRGFQLSLSHGWISPRMALTLPCEICVISATRRVHQRTSHLSISTVLLDSEASIFWLQHTRSLTSRAR